MLNEKTFKPVGKTTEVSSPILVPSKNNFKDVVKTAQEEGYTEPDPKIDLSGVDVSRKILILARECGHKVELEDVVNYKFLSDDCLNSINNDDLFKNLLKNEKHFKMLRTNWIPP